MAYQWWSATEERWIQGPHLRQRPRRLRSETPLSRRPSKPSKQMAQPPPPWNQRTPAPIPQELAQQQIPVHQQQHCCALSPPHNHKRVPSERRRPQLQQMLPLEQKEHGSLPPLFQEL